MKQFIVHVQFGEDMPETQVPIFAKSLDEANEWADETYGQHGIEVTRVRPKL
ncbi:MAG: host cell RNA polymerase inhibitor, partial [Aeromonas sp.]